MQTAWPWPLRRGDLGRRSAHWPQRRRLQADAVCGEASSPTACLLQRAGSSPNARSESVFSGGPSSLSHVKTGDMDDAHARDTLSRMPAAHGSAWDGGSSSSGGVTSSLRGRLWPDLAGRRPTCPLGVAGPRHSARSLGGAHRPVPKPGCCSRISFRESSPSRSNARFTFSQTRGTRVRGVLTHSLSPAPVSLSRPSLHRAERRRPAPACHPLPRPGLGTYCG